MNSHRPLANAGLSVTDVSIEYKVSHGLRSIKVPAVRHCSLDISPGDTLAVIGESGSGKTTISNAILGLVPISGGSIEFDGQTLCSTATGLRHPGHVAGIQVVMQDPLSSFNPRYTVYDSLSMPLRMAGTTDKHAIRDRLEHLANRVSIDPGLLMKYPHQLSGGQLQRLGIARAVSVNPKLVIADEPASKLDVSVRAQVLNLLKDILDDTRASLMLITHDLDVAKFLCRNVAIMRLGELLEFGELREVFDCPSNTYTRELLASARPDAVARSIA